MASFFVPPNSSTPRGFPQTSTEFRASLESIVTQLRAITEVDVMALSYEMRESLLEVVRKLCTDLLALIQGYRSLQAELEATQVTSALTAAAAS